MRPKLTLYYFLSTLLSVLLYCNIASAQKQNATITFDNATGEITCSEEIANLKWCKEGTSISFSIIHANPYALDSKMTAEITNADFNDGKDVFSDAMSLSSQNATTTSADNINADDVNGEMETISENVNKLRNVLSLAPIPKSDIDKLSEEKNRTLKLIQFDLSLADKERAEINRLLSLDSIVVLLMKNPDIYSRDIFDSHIINFYGSKIENSYEINQIFETHLEALKQSLQNIRFDIEILRRINELLKPTNPDDNLVAYLDSLSVLMQKIEDLYSGDNLDKINRKVLGIQMNFMNMTESGFVIQGDKMPNLSGDFLMIGDTLKLKNGTIYKAIQPIKIRSYGGTRIDFSAGFATTFGGGINGTDYFLLRDTADNVIGIDSSITNRKFDFNPVAFTHLTFKIPSVLTPGISFGVNPDFGDLEESRLMLGGTIGVSSTNNIVRRVLVSGGATFGFTDQLKPKYTNVIDFSSLNDFSDEDLSIKAPNWGWFFAVSFNLGN